MRSRLQSLPVLLASVLIACVTPQASRGTTIVQEQFRGIRGVYVMTDIVGVADADALKAHLKARVEQELSQAGLLLKSDASQWFYFEVQAVPVSCGGEGCFALLISARLREDVALKRDPSMMLPNQGLTWWRQCVKVARTAELRQSIEETLQYYVGEFTLSWKRVNPEWARPGPESPRVPTTKPAGT